MQSIHRFTLPVAVLAAASLLPAQGSYQVFGQSCAGSSTVCAAANPGTTQDRALVQNSNIFALLVPADPNLRIVTGFELFTRTTGAPSLTIDTQIYGADAAGAPTGTPLATGKMTLGPTAAYYRTTFAAPLIVNANTKLFLSYTSVASQMYFPIAATGTNVTHFWHASGATTWNGTPPNGFVTQRWAWNLLCAGGAAAKLGNTGVPTINTSMSVDLSGAPANAKALFVLGLSDTQWGAIPLPLDLSPFNAPGCNIYVSGDLQFLVTASNAGTYQFQLKVPNDANLKGLNFFNQYVVDDPGANGFGATFTNAGKGIIG